MSARRTEPSQHLVAKRGQVALAWTPAVATNIAERFARLREEQLRAEPLITVLQPLRLPAPPAVVGVVPLRLRSVRA